ncbi:MAG: hypothetical protein K2X38_01125 [Gemmataceae bacterium]|nr:hypothetical protein [Gemmataceae bacterium]
MERIQLTPEQNAIVASALDPVEIFDASGKTLGKIIPPKLETIIAECKRRSQEPGPRYSTEQVTQMLDMLEETWAKEGPCGPERLEVLLERFHESQAT